MSRFLLSVWLTGETVEREREEEREEKWRQGGELQGIRGDVTIFGWISVNVCLNAENPKTVLFSVKTISNAFIMPKRYLYIYIIVCRCECIFMYTDMLNCQSLD